jgi:hypothetical protein
MTQRDDTERLRPKPQDAPQPAEEGATPKTPPARPTPADPASEARYAILGSIHRGGMGEILLARVEGPQGFARKVVLKGLLSRLSEDNVSYQLFMREACLMARQTAAAP